MVYTEGMTADTLPEVSPQDLRPGCWYWWILTHQDAPESTEFDKYCVVRCIENERETVINVSANLEQDELYDVGKAAGRFFGPVPLPKL